MLCRKLSSFANFGTSHPTNAVHALQQPIARAASQLVNLFVVVQMHARLFLRSLDTPLAGAHGRGRRCLCRRQRTLFRKINPIERHDGFACSRGAAEAENTGGCVGPRDAQGVRASPSAIVDRCLHVEHGRALAVGLSERDQPLVNLFGVRLHSPGCIAHASMLLLRACASFLDWAPRSL